MENLIYEINIYENRRVFYNFDEVLTSSSQGETNSSKLKFNFVDFTSINGVNLTEFTKYLDCKPEGGEKFVVEIENDDTLSLIFGITKYKKLECQLVLEYEGETHIIYKTKTFDLFINDSVNASNPVDDEEIITIGSLNRKIQELEEEIAEIQFASDKTFVFEQSVPSNEWEITHNMEKYPSVTVIDSADNEVVGDIQYIDENSLIVRFNGAFSGKASLN